MPAPIWETADVLSTRCNDSLERARASRSALLDFGSDVSGADTDAVLEGYNHLLLALNDSAGWAALMSNVHPEKSVREMAEKCLQDLSSFSTDIGLDPQLHAVLASTSAHVEGRDGDTRRFVDKLLRDFRRSGVDKDEATRGRIAEINAELVKLSQDFSRNVREDRRSIEVSPADLKGLPDDWAAAHPVDDSGKVTITTDYPDFFPYQTYADSAAQRRALYQTFLQRGYPANEEVLSQVLKLRHELANTLDHPHWASYNAEDKMVKNAETVDAFIAELRSVIKPVADAELVDLVNRKRLDEPGVTNIEASDRFYYVRKIREERHQADAQALRPYFAYEQVKDGILSLYGELFQLEFVPLPDEPVWHPSVDAYELRSDGQMIGRFFLDMHPRDDKFKHAAMFDIETGLSTGRIPRASLVCNFPDPATGDGNALMEHTQVVTFFHEFGHLIHHLLANGTRWANLAGINVEWDFVEAPSQILEEWAWDPAILQRFAKHVDTGEVIPATLVERLRASEDFGKGVHLMRQLFYTAYSFFLHQRDPATLDLAQFSQEMYSDWSPYPQMPDTHVHTSFGHLIGYSSMYYTYQWSLVIAKDLFTRFQAEGLMNPVTAEAYRKAILEPGGAQDATQLVMDFLGRPHNLDAYKAWLNE
jgi:thimet oligopeptidase